MANRYLSITAVADANGCGFAITKLVKEVVRLAYIIGKACIACGVCKSECPAEAIEEGTPYVIDPAKCVDCGACGSVCPVQAAQPE